MASVPAKIATRQIPALDQALTNRLAEITYNIAKFDAHQEARDYNLPALMLRSESASSSQIERLTSSVKNVALAELSDAAPANARLISRNVGAMRQALKIAQGQLSAQAIIKMHSILMADPTETTFRQEQVWIGGTPYSPHGAAFVPPHNSRVDALVADWLEFTRRNDAPPLVKLAIAHAQFETIHPFTDGNGRAGRALLHTLLAQEGMLTHATLPISAGLLHNSDAYMQAISAYQNGEIAPIVAQIADALEVAIVIGDKIAARLDAVLDGWRAAVTERKTAAIHRLPALLVEQPVVNIAYVAENLAITERAAANLVDRACQYGILKKIGNAERGVFYQAPELIDVLEEASSASGIRRLLQA
jgi:Fic family protein